MNSRILHLVLAFAAGIAITAAFQSLIGSGSEYVAPVTSADKSPGSRVVPLRGTSASESAGSSMLPMGGNKKKSGKPATEEEKEKAKLAEKKRAEMKQRSIENMRERTEERNTIQLNYLAEALGLTPDQIARLEAGLAEDTENGIKATEGGNLAGFYRGQARQEKILGELLEGLMTPEQREAYATVQEKERGHMVEARTMRRFADLPVTLNLSEEQGDQVFDLFAAEELRSLDTPVSKPESRMKIVTMANGASAGGVISYSVGETKVDGAATKAVWQEQRRQRVEEKVEAMQPILNERQIEVYRSHLNQRNGIQTLNTGVSIEGVSIEGAAIGVQIIAD